MSEEHVQELARILQRLIAAMEPERVKVFGSEARGEVTPDREVDLLMVLPRADQPSYRLEKAATWLRPRAPFGWPIK